MTFCPHCGAMLPARPQSRMIMTGAIFIAAAFVLLLFVHLGVVVLASLLMATVGASTIRGALKAKPALCPNCRRVPRLR